MSGPDVDKAMLRLLIGTLLVHAQTTKLDTLGTEANRKWAVDNAFKTADLILAKVEETPR